MSSEDKKVHTCLWFDGEGEDAARFYASIFEDSHTGRTTHCDETSARSQVTALRRVRAARRAIRRESCPSTA
ncbi:MAG: VOC family protein [Persicimonas sp.]